MSYRPLLLLLLLLLPLGILPGTGRAAEPLRVAVSVLPQQTFVERVGGGHVEVQALVQPGQNPHSFDPTPRQVAALTQAVLYVRIGIPFEDAWMRRIQAANPDMRVLDARDGVALETRGGDDQDHDHGEAPDTHIWTSPPLAKVMARNIRDALIALDPASQGDYEANYTAFASELDDLDRAIRALLADLPSRRFLVYHPAWGYFADTYGLTQIPIEREGKEPGARALTALIEQARREGVKAIFVQPQFNRKAAEQVAEAIGGRVESIDPLAPDYRDNLLRVARLIAQASGS